MFLLVAWHGDGSPPAQSAYMYVEEPDAPCEEYTTAGANIVETVDSRPSGRSDLTLLDPDGERFTLGRAKNTIERLPTTTP